MRSLFASMLFDEDDWESSHLQQKSVVKAQASERNKAKARTKRTADNLPVHLHPSGAPQLVSVERGQRVLG